MSYPKFAVEAECFRVEKKHFLGAIRREFAPEDRRRIGYCLDESENFTKFSKNVNFR